LFCHHERKGSRVGRPTGFDAAAYKGRAAVEQSFSLFKEWRGIATCVGKLALTYWAGSIL
jgi:transposase